MAATFSQPSPQMDLFIGLSRAYVAFTSQASEVLRPFDLSLSKYNVLRIIRAHGGRLASGEIGRRMVWPSSDLTRLLDGLEDVGYIVRERDRTDRRVVHIQITPLALKQLRAIDPSMEALHQEQFKALSAREQKALAGMLDALGNFMSAPEPVKMSAADRRAARQRGEKA